MKKTLLLSHLILGLAFAELPDPHQAANSKDESATTRKLGAAPPKCTLNYITDFCRAFDPTKGEFLPMEGGARLPVDRVRSNRWKLSAEELIERDTEQKKLDNEYELKIGRKKLTVRRDMEKILDGISGLSSDFRTFFKGETGAQGGSAILFSDEFVDATIILPWPLDQEDAPLAEVPVKSVGAAFGKVVAADELKDLRQKQDELLLLQRTRPDEAQTKTTAIASKAQEEELKVIKSRAAALGPLVEKVREKVIETIARGRAENELSENEKRLIERITTIRMTKQDDPKLLNECAKGATSALNAHYSSADHTINICPTMNLFPDESLAMVIGHEIAHAIDPCNAQFNLVSLNQDALYNQFTDAATSSLKPEVLSNPSRTRLFRFLQLVGQNTPPPHLTGYPFGLDYDDDDYKLFSMRSPAVLEINVAAVPFKDHPLASVFACLTKPAVGFETSAGKNPELRIQKILKLRAKHGAVGKEDDKEIRAAINAYPECGVGGEHTQVTEAFADWVGTEVVAKIVGTKKFETAEKQLAPTGWLAQSACRDQAKYRERKGSSVNATLKNFYEDDAVSNDVHPLAVDRLEKIVLQNPVLREAFGCEKATLYCPHPLEEKK